MATAEAANLRCQAEGTTPVPSPLTPLVSKTPAREAMPSPRRATSPPPSVLKEKEADRSALFAAHAATEAARAEVTAQKAEAAAARATSRRLAAELEAAVAATTSTAESVPAASEPAGQLSASEQLQALRELRGAREEAAGLKEQLVWRQRSQTTGITLRWA